MNTFIVLSGLSCVFAGWMFFYRPTWLALINKFARERIFNDTIVLLERRKKGVLFFLISFLLFYWAYYRAQYSPTRVTGRLVSTDRMLYQSFHHFHSGEYNSSKRLCEMVLSREPGNAEALYQLAASEFHLQNVEAGIKAMDEAEKLGPSGQMIEFFRNECKRLRPAPFIGPKPQ